MAFDSLFIGVTGLTSYQSQIDTISNNIANVGTVGYKGQDVTFQDLLYQNAAFASAPTTTLGGINGQQVGDGVKIGFDRYRFHARRLADHRYQHQPRHQRQRLLHAQQHRRQRGRPSYTRDGDFSLNENGYLYDPSSGLAVLGYPSSPTARSHRSRRRSRSRSRSASSRSRSGPASAPKSARRATKSSTSSLGGNLNQTDYITAVSSGGGNVTADDDHDHDLRLARRRASGPDHLPAGHRPRQRRYHDRRRHARSPTPTARPSPPRRNGSTRSRSTDGSRCRPTAGTGYIWFDQNGQFINTSNIGSPGRGRLRDPQSRAAGDRYLRPGPAT